MNWPINHFSCFFRFFLASFYTRYDPYHFSANAVSLLVVLLAKLPMFHGVRIFGINKYWEALKQELSKYSCKIRFEAFISTIFYENSKIETLTNKINTILIFYKEYFSENDWTLQGENGDRRKTRTEPWSIRTRHLQFLRPILYMEQKRLLVSSTWISKSSWITTG